MKVNASWLEPTNNSLLRHIHTGMEINIPKLNVKVKKLSDTAIMPTYGSAQAAGMDLYADVRSMKGEKYKDKVYIAPGDCLKIPTGLAFELPEGYCSLILARSGLSVKQGLRPANCVGLCDEDYRGNYIVAVRNDSCEIQIIRHGDRIAQLVFLPYVQANLTEVDELSDTDRGDGGFGSSGDK